MWNVNIIITIVKKEESRESCVVIGFWSESFDCRASTAHKASSSLGLSQQAKKSFLSFCASIATTEKERKVGCFAAIIKEVSIESSVPGWSQKSDHWLS